LSTANAHIDVRVGEIKFTINGQEERFAFKPRPELNSTIKMVCHEQQEEFSETSSLRLEASEEQNIWRSCLEDPKKF
jgi:hypothetical protein